MTGTVEEAVTMLVKAVDYSRVVNEITRTVENARKMASCYPQCFTALVDLGLRDRDKFEAVLRQVEQERMANPDVRRQDYQRLLMRKRRARFSKMATIEKLKNPTITASQLKTHLKTQNKIMNAARDTYIGDHKDDEGFNYSEAVHQFWKITDTGLDDQLAKLRKGKA